SRYVDVIDASGSTVERLRIVAGGSDTLDPLPHSVPESVTNNSVSRVTIDLSQRNWRQLHREDIPRGSAVVYVFRRTNGQILDVGQAGPGQWSVRFTTYRGRAIRGEDVVLDCYILTDPKYLTRSDHARVFLEEELYFSLRHQGHDVP